MEKKGVLGVQEYEDRIQEPGGGEWACGRNGDGAIEPWSVPRLRGRGEQG
jgi:hypothetical protein